MEQLGLFELDPLEVDSQSVIPRHVLLTLWDLKSAQMKTQKTWFLFRSSPGEEKWATRRGDLGLSSLL